MNLEQEIKNASSLIKKDSYSMSVGELANLYIDKEIDLHPAFQRVFRWKPKQKSRLIESVLLGIPLPPIFVYQDETGKWDVIDGVQRLSTLFQFMGILRDENGELVDPLILEKTEYLPSLHGKKWEGKEGDKNAFSFAQRLFIKRAKIDLIIILKESDQRGKFELFQRLNTGGSSLSDQEIRNCLLLMIDKDFYLWLESFRENLNFTNCIMLSGNSLEQQYDLELVSRFFVLRNIDPNEVKAESELGEYLNRKMQEMSLGKQFNKEEESEAFNVVFSFLADTLGEDSFRRYDAKKEKFLGAFTVSSFESLALGLGFNYKKISSKTFKNEIVNKVKKMWEDKLFINFIGSGVRATTRIPNTIKYGRKNFAG